MQVIGLSLERVKILQRGKQHILTCDHNSMRPRSCISIKTVLPLDGTAISKNKCLLGLVSVSTNSLKRVKLLTN